MPIKKLQEDFKDYFQANLLDGDDINDCGGAIIDAKEVYEVCLEFISIQLNKAYELGREEEREEREENKKIIEDCDCAMEYDENRNPILHHCANHKKEEEERLGKLFKTLYDHSKSKS